MQHNITDNVLEAFHQVTAGRPASAGMGLSVVPLFSSQRYRGLVAASRMTLQCPLFDTAQLRWDEISPPHPRRVRVQNPSPQAMVIDIGTLLIGGMSTRATASTVVVAGDATATIEVEPVGARWADRGPLQTFGHTQPLTTALLFQAAIGVSWVAASARTLLSSAWAGPDESFKRTERKPALDSDGAIVRDAVGTVMAAWLLRRNQDPRRHLQRDYSLATWIGDRQSEFSALLTGIESGALVPHVFGGSSWGRDLVLLPPGSRLVDRIAARGAE
jgi:hypothetical protein